MRKKVLFIKLILVFIIGTIFTFINSNISNANDVRWDLYFENIRVSDGSVPANQEARITGPSRTEISFDVTLRVPGDFYEFTVDAVNNGTVDAMIAQIGINRLTEAQKKYMSYDVTYNDGTAVMTNDKLSAGTTKKLKVRILYRTDVNPDDLPTTASSTMSLTLHTSYVQADENAVEREETNSTANNNNNNNNSSVINNSGGGTTVYVTNNGGNNNNNSNSTKSNNRVSRIIRNVATGDSIVKYIIILTLAIVALLLSFWKRNH